MSGTTRRTPHPPTLKRLREAYRRSAGGWGENADFDRIEEENDFIVGILFEAAYLEVASLFAQWHEVSLGEAKRLARTVEE
jgi:hypothetical protein